MAIRDRTLIIVLALVKCVAIQSLPSSRHSEQGGSEIENRVSRLLWRRCTQAFLVATIISTQGITPEYQKRRFSTFNNAILAFRQWLLDNHCLDVCMESTGKYWIPVYNLLEDTIRVTIANPKWVAAVKGNKDGVKDSKWIGDLFRLGLVPSSFIPPKKIRILREYTRYRYKLVSCKSSEKNRFQNAFTVCNVALDAVVSDIFGKSAASITDYLVNGDSFDPAHCVSLLQRSLKTKAEEVLQSIEGFQMTEEQKQRLRFVRQFLDFVNTGVFSSFPDNNTVLHSELTFSASRITLMCESLINDKKIHSSKS